ncbi:hypothetical protein J6590_107159 [Homalodisca vitripennis]|nr:hypothetical protein J6590_107159 [Homalodisca vitripennis]
MLKTKEKKACGVTGYSGWIRLGLGTDFSGDLMTRVRALYLSPVNNDQEQPVFKPPSVKVDTGQYALI